VLATRLVFQHPDKETARLEPRALVDRPKSRLLRAADLLKVAEEKTLAHLDHPGAHRTKLRSPASFPVSEHRMGASSTLPPGPAAHRIDVI
jgi:hypothetical protein